MVRAYAKLLKLDPDPLVGRIAAQTAVPDNAAAVVSVRRPIPITDSARRTNLVYAAFSLAILGVIGAVVFEWQRDRARAARMTFIPAAQTPQEAQRAAVTNTVASAAASTVASTVTPQMETLGSESPPAPPKAADGTRRIVMRFERESWTEIRGGDGKVLASQLNAAGSERSVEGRPPFALVIGNAQHVRLTYDDKPVDLAPHVKVEVARFTLN
jgi:cytoskeleton protein RodZ